MARNYIEERDGGLYLTGTRVSLDSIVQCFEAGLSAESIADEFETLTLAQVYGALAHYLENQPAIDSYRLRQRRRFAAERAAAPSLSDSMRQGIDEARVHLRSEAHVD